MLPGSKGAFNGRLSEDNSSITGYWVQPIPVVSDYPFSTPVSLKLLQHSVWSGNVSPLNDTVSLYLVVKQETDGALVAFFRNPECAFYSKRTFQLKHDGSRVVLTNTQNKDDQLTGTYDELTKHLSLRIPNWNSTLEQFGETFEFTKRDRDNAVGFYPRTPETSRYTYRQPLSEADGWQTASLQDAGLDRKKVAAAVEKILGSETTSGTSPYIQSLLVARHGKLVLEEYFYGFSGNRPHDLRSAGKSFTSALVGIAIDHHAGFGLETPIYSLFPEYKHFANPDPRKSQITVKDLLTMTSGLAGNDNDDSSPGNEMVMFAQQETQHDFYKYVLDLPMASAPGGKQAVYFTGGINLLGGIVRNTMKMPLDTFFDEYLAQPLDIHNYHLNLTPTGDVYGGGGLYLRPRDALKLGQLYLDGGVWNTRRVVSKNWVDLSTRRYASFNAEHGYGFAWHLFDLRFSDRVYHEYEAEGNGGQLTIVIPDLDLTVSFTTGNYGNDMTMPERDVLAGVVSAIIEQ